MTCYRCHEEKPSGDFYKSRHHSRGYAGYCKPCNLIRKRAYAEKNRVFVRAKYNASNRKLKDDVILLYSDGFNECKCCGVSQREFLTIDHINGGGTKHRESLGGTRSLYLWLKKERRPDFQVLCFNCNAANGFFGTCPHKRVNQ